MKKIYIISLFFFSVFSFGQNPIIPIESLDGSTPPIGAYLKDTNNRQIPYIGTWRYAQNGKELTIVLRRFTMAPLNRGYADLLFGEYKYVENGITIINTLPNLDADMPNKWNHNISGSFPIDNLTYPLCPDCTNDEKRMVLGLFDPLQNIGGLLTLRRISVNGSPALHMYLIEEQGNTVSEELAGDLPDPGLLINIRDCILLKVD
ncbi:hypothetical protein GV828_05085 [Flavobacterium sp. NST-5]|uniref:DUF6705 domain-containing protein n=1 Tax=Flavobacterium ichthyis TaxID=2698827 RepID=A0ABW9ZCT5_9FLAO|nr:DUF6705 family protein [Flavobacterium ichthyis]NBL64573.1 hypothetical protein [Flavobacterium ichthyis]